MAIVHDVTQSTQPDELAERMQTEQKVLLNKTHQEGFELGIRSTSTLSYKDFQHFERVSPLSSSFDEDVMDYLWSFLDAHGYPKDARTHDPDFVHLLDLSPESRIHFTQGWLEGVLSVWHTIKAQVGIAR